MSIAAIKVKIMPLSPESNLKEIEENVKKTLSKNQVKGPQFQQEPVAFGLKALLVLFGWPEEKPLEELEDSLKKINNVSSVEILDIRRAIG